MAHKHSEQNMQRRETRRIVQRFAFQDFTVAETVNTLTHDQIAGELAVVFPESFSFDVVVRYDCGEVLTDSLGRGSLQRTKP